MPANTNTQSNFPGYRDVSLLATTLQNNVYSAVDCASRHVAIKCPILQNSTKAEHDQMLLISHPSILGLLDTIATPAGPALVFPFAEGNDLFKAMTKSGGIDEQFVKVVIYRVLKGLQFLHCQGYMHRDIKPENIFLLEKDSADSAVLADLGFLCQIPDGQHDQTFPGTSCYIAPEMWLREGYTEKVDLWALGVTAYVALAGRFPFKSEIGSTMMVAEILTGLPVHRRAARFMGASLPCQEFISKLLSVDHMMRPTAADALQHAWFQDLRAAEEAKPKPIAQITRFMSGAKVDSEITQICSVSN
jgi:serine/threonine protein kinase